MKGNEDQHRERDCAAVADAAADPLQPFRRDIAIEPLLADFDADPEGECRACHRAQRGEQGHHPPEIPEARGKDDDRGVDAERQ